MSPTMMLFMTCVLIGGMLSSGQAAAVPGAARDARENAPPAREQPATAPIWTTWGANQVALADDGASIWIGGVGGIERWDKQQHSFHRYSAVDGLPHTAVFAAAVDGSGNRWFGGDGGLSRLDGAQQWTHFRAANSGLYSDLVVAIAIAGDALYLSHGLPGGSVSRLDGDGTWHWFPSRETAIQMDYGSILQTRNATPLWTVAGAEVWAGSHVFDGVSWQVRELPGSVVEPISLASDSQNHVWALSGGSTVYEWDGAGWLAHYVQLHFSGAITALAVDSDDRVWIGLHERGSIPYSYETAYVRDLSGAQISSLGVVGPVTALLSAPEGLWAVGPSWLMTPDLTVTVLTDGPRFTELTDAMVAGDGSLWLPSGARAGYTLGAIQALDDRGTLALEDDAWPVQPTDYLPGLGRCEAVTAFERAVGDLWYAHYCYFRLPSSPRAVRYHGDQRIEYALPEGTTEVLSDVFSQDKQHIWFVSWGGGSGHVFGLDEGGTPADTGDDVWQTFPIETVSEKPVVAVDALGRLWLGQASGLYRHDGSSWQLIYGGRPVCDLAPAADGTLYAQVAPAGVTACQGHSDEIVVVRADGTIANPAFGKWLIAAEPDLVLTAHRRNSLWTIASDGAIWYISHLDPGQELQRRSGSGLTTYALPVEPDAVQRLEVDPRGHVWLVAGSQLWRMEGPRPLSGYLPLIYR